METAIKILITILIISLLTIIGSGFALIWDYPDIDLLRKLTTTAVISLLISIVLLGITLSESDNFHDPY